ncbi:hypothetical protein GOP47_0019214, partial [Adiantum capillus-veneris]
THTHKMRERERETDMRQVWRVLSTLRLPTLCEQGLVARQSYALATFRSLWKPAFQPLPSRFVHWRTPPLPQPQPRPQLEQCRTFASKVKKYKMKSYTAFKGRFKLKANGEYKRWRAGKRHNAHSKTNKQLRQLRRPAVVHSAYATVMKKLNFHG